MLLGKWTQLRCSRSVDLLFTTGAAGAAFGPTYFTPEVLMPLLHRQVPGIAQALSNEGLKHAPFAVLSYILHFKQTIKKIIMMSHIKNKKK